MSAERVPTVVIVLIPRLCEREEKERGRDREKEKRGYDCGVKSKRACVKDMSDY